MKRKLISLVLSAAVLLLAGCSREEQGGPAGQQRVNVSVTFTGQELQLTKAFGNTHNVDRILLLPLIKADASASDTPANFAPEFSLAKQVDVAAFPTSDITLSLIKGMSYKVLAIGYNGADYTYNPANPIAVGTRFSLASPATLATLQLVPTSPFSVPEFFTCLCMASGSETFVADEGVTLAGDLKRIVGGLSLTVNNIPATVTSLELHADMLTTALAPLTGAGMEWQTAVATDTNVLSTQVSAAGSAVFDVFMSPSVAGQATKLFLDVTEGGIETRYDIKVNDLVGVSTANAITFTPNKVVSITGDYGDINFGAIITITDGINLDDDAWDGL